MKEVFKKIPNTELMYRCNPIDVTIICENKDSVTISWDDMMFITRFSEYAPWIATALDDKSTPDKVKGIVGFMKAVNKRDIPEAIEYGIV